MIHGRAPRVGLLVLALAAAGCGESAATGDGETGGGSVLAIGASQDSACYAGAFGGVFPLTQDAIKETTQVAVGATNASAFSPGDLAQLDEVDDGTVMEGDCAFFKRVDHRSTTDRVEIASVDASSGVLTLRTPLHWTFRPASPPLPQIARVTLPATRWA